MEAHADFHNSVAVPLLFIENVHNRTQNFIALFPSFILKLHMAGNLVEIVVMQIYIHVL